MHVISRKALRDAVRRLPPAQRLAAEKAYSAWYKVASDAQWNSFAEVKLTFNTADSVAGKLVFDIGGNKHRVVALPAYRSKRLYVLFAGSHKEYDALDVAEM
jgi:mRNA interferase HigB